jgi:hypothetical protein
MDLSQLLYGLRHGVKVYDTGKPVQQCAATAGHMSWPTLALSSEPQDTSGLLLLVHRPYVLMSTWQLAMKKRLIVVWLLLPYCSIRIACPAQHFRCGCG